MAGRTRQAERKQGSQPCFVPLENDCEDMAFFPQVEAKA